MKDSIDQHSSKAKYYMVKKGARAGDGEDSHLELLHVLYHHSLYDYLVYSYIYAENCRITVDNAITFLGERQSIGETNIKASFFNLLQNDLIEEVTNG